ncbi:hypothetical protein EVAR_4727_1 [Eumeta japonica]|uniref:Uncharacterized protein n=1 Tax=Eumeta variegata TaxID=151549 RepID=A0A4C1SYK2_EUMVA|nr:hypothetical protein EVAR_4727_1 [Eumeta japonica]
MYQRRSRMKFFYKEPGGAPPPAPAPPPQPRDPHVGRLIKIPASIALKIKGLDSAPCSESGSVASREPRAVYAAKGCGWESLMKSVTLGNVTMSHRTRERPAECLASLPLNYDRSAARSTRELVHSLQMYCKLFAVDGKGALRPRRATGARRQRDPSSNLFNLPCQNRYIIKMSSPHDRDTNPRHCRTKLNNNLIVPIRCGVTPLAVRAGAGGPARGCVHTMTCDIAASEVRELHQEKNALTDNISKTQFMFTHPVSFERRKRTTVSRIGNKVVRVVVGDRPSPSADGGRELMSDWRTRRCDFASLTVNNL